MAAIHHDLLVSAPPAAVFAALSTPQGLDSWWTLRCSGTPELDAEYTLWFGREYDWRGLVVRLTPEQEIAWRLTSAHPDWLGSEVSLRLENHDSGTLVRFDHSGWPEENDHYRTSCYCWAMYLRLMKRYVESGEVVPYAERLEA